VIKSRREYTRLPVNFIVIIDNGVIGRTGRSRNRVKHVRRRVEVRRILQRKLGRNWIGNGKKTRETVSLSLNEGKGYETQERKTFSQLLGKRPQAKENFSQLGKGKVLLFSMA
jgi:hypothetical protein